MTTRNSSATVLILRARAKALNSRANRSVSGGRSFMSSANMVSGSRDGFCTNFFSFGEVVITMCRMPSFVISFQRAYGYPGAHGTGSGSDLADSEVVAYKAPGRYRSLYRTNSPAVSLGTALVVISRFYTFPSQETLWASFYHCQNIAGDYQSGPERYRWQTLF